MFVVLILLFTRVAAADPISWLQLSPGCTVQPMDIEGRESQVVPCGGAGSFLFGGPDLSYAGQCSTVGKGTETPALIPAEPEPRLSPSFPCFQGSCLVRSGQPWVAVLDWQTPHGWSVAATIREASDERVDVQLFDLAEAGAIASRVPSVSDVHVLVQLCAVAEAAQAGDPPLAVNMSFGRRADTDTDLGGAVGRVLSYLRDEEGIVTVAAAGNHHEMLFPASVPGVIPAGALDLARLELSGEVRASAQTPPETRALVLGYGLYLSAENGDWPAPPGSSYAAAMFTGWLGGALADSNGNPELKGDHWAPLPTSKGVALALDGVPLVGSELAGPRRFFERAMGEAPVLSEKGAYATLRLDGAAPPLPEFSVLHADSGNGPQPGVNPCVPCHGSGESGGLESRESVFVDLSYSAGLPSGTEMVAVLLRVGGEVYAFEGSRDPDLMNAMAAGQVEGLILDEVGGILVPGEQPSLVLVVNVGGTSYWHEVPQNLHR
jgi:hypothetical protein